MGADLVYVYYGVKRSIAAGDLEQLDSLEADKHPICDLAYDNKLHFTWGRLTDGADYYLLIGNEIGAFGVEEGDELNVSDVRLAEIMAKTKDRLKTAGIDEAPALLIQLRANS